MTTINNSQLIEKVGGIEKAKEHRDYLIDFGNEFNRPNKHEVDKLNDALLKYRRENNIFEVGDVITFNDSDFIYRIDTRNQDGFHATTVHEVKRCIIALFGHNDIKHATPSEIKAGHRIDDNTGHATDIRNHVSPSTKLVDLVVLDHPLTRDRLIQFPPDGSLLSLAIKNGDWSCRHADPEEIKAGHRLEAERHG